MSSFSEPHLGSKHCSVTTRDSLSTGNRFVNFKDINGTFRAVKRIRGGRRGPAVGLEIVVAARGKDVDHVRRL